MRFREVKQLTQGHTAGKGVKMKVGTSAAGPRGFPGGSVIKNPSAMQEMQETQVRSLGQEDPLGRKWQPTPIFLPGRSHRHRSLVGYVHGVAKSWKQLSN